MDDRRDALGAFLRSRRDGLSPVRAGMRAFPGPRRVPGLRREELAFLAGLSPDYYSRVEQGRQLTVSTEVLDALARALRLSPVEAGHLHDLAAPIRRRTPAARQFVQRPDPGLLRLLDTLAHRPVLLLGYRAQVLASNALLRSVLGRPMDEGSSFPRYMFTDPVARERIVNWAQFARATVGALRWEAGRRPEDTELRTLTDELTRDDQDFAHWWSDHGVRNYASVAKRCLHPAAGELSFDIEVVSTPQDPDQRLVIYTAELDSATARVLPLLASWDAADLPR